MTVIFLLLAACGGALALLLLLAVMCPPIFVFAVVGLWNFFTRRR